MKKRIFWILIFTLCNIVLAQEAPSDTAIARYTLYLEDGRTLDGSVVYSVCLRSPISFDFSFTTEDGWIIQLDKRVSHLKNNRDETIFSREKMLKTRWLLRVINILALVGLVYALK